MAVVEAELLSDSEDEANKIEVVVEEGDSWDEDSEDEEAMELKIKELECNIQENAYNYKDHADLLELLLNSSNIEKYREAFKRLQTTLLVEPQDWMTRLNTERSLALPENASDITQLFEEACIDCHYHPILIHWVTYVLSLKPYVTPEKTREELKEIIKRGGADPFRGKLFWETAAEMEKEILSTLTESDEQYTKQAERVLYYLEEIVCRPILNGDASWKEFEELALKIKDKEYVDKVKQQHIIAQELLLKLTEFEDKLLTMETSDKNALLEVYREYIEKVINLEKKDARYAECDIDNILKILYDRATFECLGASDMNDVFRAYLRFGQKRCSLSSQIRIVDICIRRRPAIADGWVAKIQLWDDMGKSADEMRLVIEQALNQDLETYKDAESIWMEYLTYIRRRTDPSNADNVESLRKHFRNAWESLTFTWEDEGSDCRIPLFWARLEYKVFGNPKQGKELFEEMFSYGTNKTMSKYWESLIRLETSVEAHSKNKLRDLYRRAVKFIEDYPPTVCDQWIEFERDYGTLTQLQDAVGVCEDKVKAWRANYEAQRRNMQGNQNSNKKAAFKKKNQPKKRKFEDGDEKNNKRKKENDAKPKEVDKKIKETKENKKGLKRVHENDNKELSTKRAKSEEPQESSEPATRENCTLFVSNLEFKVDEEKLREKLSEFGDIVSMRVRAGVKAFGGSICYCQYKAVSSVEKALKNDRTPLDGRPMFFSKYNEKKGKQFKYSTGAENNKLFVRNLPYSACNKEALTQLFEKYGELEDIRIVTFKDGKPKGLAYVEYANEESAKKALECDGHVLEERALKVDLSNPPAKDNGGSLESSLGAARRDNRVGMRRTQLSNLIPTVVQRAKAAQSTSVAEQKPSTSGQKMSNSDFRNMLLNK